MNVILLYYSWAHTRMAFAWMMWKAIVFVLSCSADFPYRGWNISLSWLRSALFFSFKQNQCPLGLEVWLKSNVEIQVRTCHVKEESEQRFHFWVFFSLKSPRACMAVGQQCIPCQGGSSGICCCLYASGEGQQKPRSPPWGVWAALGGNGLVLVEWLHRVCSMTLAGSAASFLRVCFQPGQQVAVMLHLLGHGAALP